MTITSIRADNALSQLVRAMIPRGSGQDGTGLYIRLDVRGSNYDYARWDGELMPRVEAETKAGEHLETLGLPDNRDEDAYPWAATASADLHFLVFRPTNYTQVFVLRNDSWSIPTGAQPWEILADHDSCWPDAFRYIDEIVEELRKATCPGNLGPGCTYPDISHGFCDDVTIANVRLVLMESEPVYGSTYRRRRRQAAIKSLKEPEP